MCNWTKRHSGFTRNFRELSFKQQASSISAVLMNLQKAINAHCENIKASDKTKVKCIEQVRRLIDRV